MPLDRRIVIRRIKFLEQLTKLHSQHVVLAVQNMSAIWKKELHWFRSILWTSCECFHVYCRVSTVHCLFIVLIRFNSVTCTVTC